MKVTNIKQETAMSSKSKFPVLMAGFAGMAFFGLAFVVMGAVLPSLISKFGLDTSQASTVAGLLPIGILLGSVIFGPVIDRYGYKRLMIAATVVTVAGMELLAFCSSVYMARISIFVIGFGGGILNGISNALVSDASTDKNRSANLSILGVFYTIGAITIPLLFATLSKTISYTPIVAGAGVVMTLSVFYYAFVSFPDGKFKQGIPFKKVLSMAKEPALLLLSFTLFFQSGIEGIASNWTSSYLELEKGFDKESALYALSLIVMGIGAGRIVLGFLLRKISKNIILTISILIAALGTLIMYLFTSQAAVSAGTFMIGLGLASTFPIVLSEVGEKYKEMSGTAFSFALVIALTGNTLINLLVGALDFKQFPILLIICSLLVPVIYLINYQYFRSKN